jgi:hypothetical protein
MGGSYCKNGRRKKIQERFIMGIFIIQDHWENQEQDGRTSSGGTHHILGVRGRRRRAEDRIEWRLLPYVFLL